MRRRVLSIIYTTKRSEAPWRLLPGNTEIQERSRHFSRTMQAGFYIIMAAQFFSSLADNALLVAAIQMLRDLESPAWMTPSLKQCLHRSLRAARPGGRRVRRFDAQGARDADHQRHQDPGLRRDVVHAAPAGGLCHCGPGRRRVFAGEVRHPDRVPAGAQAGRRQRLDRGHHRRLDHPRRAAGRHADQRSGVQLAARDRHSEDRYRHRHAAAGGDRGHHGLLWDRRADQLVYTRHRRPAPRAEQESAVPDPRICSLQRPAVARQARPDLAGNDHPVLGSRCDAAVHRHRLGSDAPVLQPVARIVSAGRGCRRHRARCGAGGKVRLAQ